MEQKVIWPDNVYKELDEWIEVSKVKQIMLVCGNSLKYMDTLNSALERLTEIGVSITRFSGYNPNPEYESVVAGVGLFRENGCEAIIAVGGGSAIDVAKCIKLYADCLGNGENGEWLNEVKPAKDIPFMAIPTTAGSGSEATRYAVIYYECKKQSITNESIIPNTVLMLPELLKNLPLYQKKSTMCDALSHAIESCWSVNSTEESKGYSREAIKGVLDNYKGYLANSDVGNEGMLRAAYMAGKAIDITATTAGHAMCYKITGMFGLAHGHGAMLCNCALFSWMIDNMDKCIDYRGEDYLRDTLDEIGVALGGTDARSGAVRLQALFEELEMEVPGAIDEQIQELAESVNTERLKNFPVLLSDGEIAKLYYRIMNNQ